MFVLIDWISFCLCFLMFVWVLFVFLSLKCLLSHWRHFVGIKKKERWEGVILDTVCNSLFCCFFWVDLWLREIWKQINTMEDYTIRQNWITYKKIDHFFKLCSDSYCTCGFGNLDWTPIPNSNSIKELAPTLWFTVSVAIQKIYSNNMRNRMNTKLKRAVMIDIKNRMQNNPAIFFQLHSIYHSGFGCYMLFNTAGNSEKMN